jgi:hypothetical protein
MMRNMIHIGNNIVRAVRAVIGESLPAGWTVQDAQAPKGAPANADAYLRMTSPDRVVGILLVEVKTWIEPRDVGPLVGRLPEVAEVGLLVAAPFLSPAVRERLREAGVSYVDLAGNARIVMAKPGIFVLTHGADINPDRSERPSRSLKGPKAGRVVRALVDSARPPGVRELAERAAVNPGYVSRVLALLDREALIVREGRGRIASVDWQRLLRRWAQDAPLSSRGRQVTCLEPRGLAELERKLKKLSTRYVLTASSAAARFAPLAPARLAVAYSDDVERAIEELGLRTTDAGANVVLIEPVDDGVYAGSTVHGGLRYVAASQCAADLLTSPGRGPSEADELITWMAAHEEMWRG